jgi:hypothetical protein
MINGCSKVTATITRTMPCIGLPASSTFAPVLVRQTLSAADDILNHVNAPLLSALQMAMWKYPESL